MCCRPPRRKIERRYTVEEIESAPELRDAMPRIEIDTVHFGFSEAFVREEEVDNLDRIAEIMERSWRASARGLPDRGPHRCRGLRCLQSELSRARAEAIKQALTTYYVIPPET